jgi:hypothetical protein
VAVAGEAHRKIEVKIEGDVLTQGQWDAVMGRLGLKIEVKIEGDVLRRG